jgi:hypothetical protein
MRICKSKPVPLRHAGAKGKRNIALIHSWHRHQMRVSGQRHAPAALCRRGKDLRYQLDRRLGGPQSWSGHKARGKILCMYRGWNFSHSVSDVVEYVTTEKVTRIYFQHTYCVRTPVGNSNILGLYWLITSYFEDFFLKDRMNISDSLHKLRISHRMSFSHYKQNTCVSQI